MSWLKPKPTKGMTPVELRKITVYSKEGVNKFKKMLDERGISSVVTEKPNLGYEIKYGVVKRRK